MSTLVKMKSLGQSYYTPKGNFAPLDGRQKIYIDDTEEIDKPLFNKIPALYPHLRVHVHKKINDGEEYCVGVYEIDTLNVIRDSEDSVESIEVKSFHQVYSTAQGTKEDYLDKTNNEIQEGEEALSYNEKYKNIIFYASDTKKVYLNGELYGGSEGNWSIDEGDETFNDY